ncbi:MAG TPA: haloacid dehalogenase type II [Candidatus Dormibacteraeota bacterium]|nr:haloacid dehalogenase type II [Candidatus Dormibacteraeota bacterium]
MTGIEAVVFDAYGTLFDVNRIPGLPAEAVVTLREKQLQYSWLVSLMGTYRDFRDLTRAAAEHALARHRVRDASVEQVMEAQLRLPLYPEARAALDIIGRRRRLAVLSNGHPESLDALLEAAGVRDRFQQVMSAHEVRVFKPAPAVYRLAPNRLGLAPERLLFVSANGWDAAGAAAAGLRVAWVNRSGAPREGIGGEPELVVPDLAELARRLG